MSSSNHNTDAAIKFLLERRWPMVPSIGTCKGPCVKWKRFQRQLPTIDQLRGWCREFRPTRWGPVTGRLAGIVVVDFDGVQGISLMRAWGIHPHVRTGSGGFHWYAVHPGWPVPTLNAKTAKNIWPWPGVDIRGDGGFAVLLGRNENGSYQQLRELNPEPFDALPAEIRLHLRNHRSKTTDAGVQLRLPELRRTGNLQVRVDSQLLIEKALGMAGASGRNNAGFWLACQLRDNDYTKTEADVAMRSYRPRVGSVNTRGQSEQYTEREMLASIGEAYSRSPRNPWKRQNTLPHSDVGLAENRDQTQLIKSADFTDIDLYVDHRSEPLVDHMGGPLSRGRFSRIPAEVLSDQRLIGRDVRVYGALAEAHWTRSASVGTRALAKRANYSRRLIVESLRRLDATGHIRKEPRKKGQRAQYVLSSPIFHQTGSVGKTPDHSISMRKSPAEVVSMPRRTSQK